MDTSVVSGTVIHVRSSSFVLLICKPYPELGVMASEDAVTCTVFETGTILKQTRDAGIQSPYDVEFNYDV